MAEFGDLTVVFAECPSYWTPDGSVADCAMMAGTPDLRVTDIANEANSFPKPKALFR